MNMIEKTYHLRTSPMRMLSTISAPCTPRRSCAESVDIVARLIRLFAVYKTHSDDASETDRPITKPATPSIRIQVRSAGEHSKISARKQHGGRVQLGQVVHPELYDLPRNTDLAKVQLEVEQSLLGARQAEAGSVERLVGGARDNGGQRHGLLQRRRT
eukprot:4642644-Prymnesium_polylepis.1